MKESGKKKAPPRWADKFLEWYCRPDLLEEIQGDAYELYFRTEKKSSLKADWQFAWNVIRFFRWKNIRKKKYQTSSSISGAMVKNILLVSIRNFTRHPGHSFMSVIGLAVGFICAFLIMLWVSHEFSFDKFHSSSDRLYKIITHVETDGGFQTYDASGFNINTSVVPEVESITHLANGERWPFELCFRPEGKTDECIYLNGVYASANLFNNFDFPILYGDKNSLKEPSRIAISEKMAEVLYNNSNPIGKTIKIDDVHEVVIGSVFKNVPANSSLKFDFVLPFSILGKQWGINEERLSKQFFQAYIKTVNPVASQLLTDKINHSSVIGEEYLSQKIKYEAVPFTQWHLNSTYENAKNTGGRIDYVFLFIVIGVLVVIMAVINFINITTARASLRAKEIGIRKVTGALRSSLLVQFMGESFITVLTAFAIALFVTQLFLPLFSMLLGESVDFSLFTYPHSIYIGIFLITVSLMAGVYPALVLSSFQPAKILKGLAVNTSRSMPLRKVLMTVQLSVAIGIILFSMVIFRQLDFIMQKNMGFDRENIIRIEPTYSLLKKYDAFKNELLNNTSIEAVGSSDTNPLLASAGNIGVEWPGKPKDQRISFKIIGSYYDFPETVGLKILDGRGFLPDAQIKDSLATEVLISRKAAQMMGLEQPVGDKIKIEGAPCEIIGVINDIHTGSLREHMEPVIIYRKDVLHTSAIYVKYKPGTTQASMESVQKTYKQYESKMTMKYWFQDETFNSLYKTEATVSKLVFMFAVVALVIAIMGIAGLATFNVERKTKEIGIRRVLGASFAQVLYVLFSEFSIALFIAILISFPLTWYAASDWLSGYADRVSLPWWLFAAVLNGAVTLILSIIWIQGKQVITANPTQSLRSE